MFFQVYTILAMVLSGSFSTEPFQAVDRKLANIYFSITLAILNILCLNLFIALISLLFTRMYENAQAQALLQRAECMMQSERNLSMKASNLVKKYIRKNCGPLVSYYHYHCFYYHKNIIIIVLYCPNKALSLLLFLLSQ